MTLATAFLIYRFYLSIAEIIESSKATEVINKGKSTENERTPILK
jgi:hypothetical protein